MWTLKFYSFQALVLPTLGLWNLRSLGLLFFWTSVLLNFRTLELPVYRTFIPLNFRFLELLVFGASGLWDFQSHELLVFWTSSLWDFQSHELLVFGTFSLTNSWSFELLSYELFVFGPSGFFFSGAFLGMNMGAQENRELPSGPAALPVGVHKVQVEPDDVGHVVPERVDGAPVEWGEVVRGGDIPQSPQKIILKKNYPDPAILILPISTIPPS